MKTQSQNSQFFYQSEGYKYKELQGQPKISNANIFLFRNSTFSKKATKTFRYLFSQTSGGRRDQSYPQWYPRQYFVRTVVQLLVPLVCQPVSSTTLCCYSIYGNISQYLVIVPRVHKCKAPLCATMYYCQWL